MRTLCTCIVLGMALGLCAERAEAQASRDAEFAGELLNRGYVELAEQEARRIEGESRYSMQVRGDAGYLLVRVLKRKAQETGNPDLLAEVSKLIEELKKRYPSHNQSQVADLEQLQAKLTEAEALLGSAEDEGDEAKAAELRARSAAVFEEALARFDEVIKRIEEQLSKDRSDDLEFKRDLAEYLRANAYLTFGLAQKEGARRTEALERALKEFDLFFDQRAAFMNLWLLGYLGGAKALIELKRYDDAVAKLQDAQYIEIPWSDKPDIRARQEKFLKDIKSEAFYWLLVAAVRSGQNDRALTFFDDLNKQYPDARKTHFGKLAVFEYAKALAGMQRLHEAGDAIGEVLEESMASPDVIPGFDIDRYGVSACKALADIAAKSSGFFRAPLQYRAGQGFFFKADWEGATYALKGVLAAGASAQEREQWGAKALLDLGAVYQKFGRTYEAALAYQGLYRMFPNHESAGGAMRMAKQLFSQMAEKDPWYRKLSDEVTKDEQELLSGIGAEKSKYNQAAEWQKQGRFADAAAKLLEIPETIDGASGKQAVPFYGEAVATAGFCYYKAALKAQGDSQKQFMAKATSTLERALEYGKRAGQPSAWAAAAFYQSLILGSDDAKQYEKALELLEPFEGELKSQRGYVPGALAQMVHCFVKLGRLAEAEEALAKLGRDPGTGDDLPAAALEVAGALGDKANVAAEAGRSDEAKALVGRAAKHAVTWAQKGKGASFSGLGWAASLAFRAEMFEDAKALYERALSENPRDSFSEADRKALVFEESQLQLALALAALGKRDEAVKLFNTVKEAYTKEGKDPYKDFLFTYGYADSLYRVYMLTKDEKVLPSLKEAHEKFYAILRATGESGWPELAASYNLERETYAVAEKRAVARLMEIQLGLREWDFVRYQIDTLIKQGHLDDLVHTKKKGTIVGEVLEESDASVKIKDRKGAEHVFDKADVRSVERFPKDLRDRFNELRERAVKGGRL